MAGTLGNIGLIHQSLGDYAKALGYQERALEMREELGDRAGIAGSLLNIGNIHNHLGAYAKAQEVRTFHHSADATDNTKPQTMRFQCLVTELRA